MLLAMGSVRRPLFTNSRPSSIFRLLGELLDVARTVGDDIHRPRRTAHQPTGRLPSRLIIPATCRYAGRPVQNDSDENWLPLRTYP